MKTATPVFDLTRRWAEQTTLPLWCAYEATSTNDIAKNEAFLIDSPIKLYLAATQSAGRGRYDRQWTNPPDGGGLLSSWSVAFSKAPGHLSGLRVGLALYRAAHRTWPDVAFSLKAPNDLYLADQKVGGLLLEVVSQGYTGRWIAGLGLNVSTRPEVVPTATHLGTAIPGEIDLGRFLAAWLQELKQAAVHMDAATLDVLERRQLLQALNQNPLLSAPLQQVLPDGSLQQYTGVTIKWTDL